MADVPTQEGIVSKPSPYPVAGTLDRLEAAVTSKGMRVFARIDQRAAAEEVGLTLRPTELLIFGDPKAGTPLMDAHPLLAVDLPLKALAWQDDGGQVWLSYHSPEDLAQRHELDGDPFAGLHRLTDAALASGH
jgi:uncharacterized protein (DUF302 family)